MITETSDKDELVTAIDKAVSEMLALMSSLDESRINSVPYEDSWTAGQLFRHVAKSISGMAKAMSIGAWPAERYAGERIPELKKVFLDFSIKMKSPDFIVPENGPYNKEAIMAELSESFSHFKESTDVAILTDMVENLPLGPITKLEMLHFVFYHTQRHLHQMKKICEALNKG